MCIAAAIIGGAVVGAAGSAIAGSESSHAITSSTNASIAAQQSAQQKQQALNAPYAGIGTGGAIQQYENLLGTGPQGSAGVEQALQATPGYQFAKTQGLTATTNAASAMGLTLSGNTLQSLDQFSTGLADSTYQQALGNAQNAVTIGQNAAAGTGAGILQTGANIGSTISNAGNTIAGIDANTVAGIAKAGGNAANQYITANTLQGLDNPYGFTPGDAGAMQAYQSGVGSTGLIPAGGGYMQNVPGT
jgi:hypothetical protein